MRKTIGLALLAALAAEVQAETMKQRVDRLVGERCRIFDPDCNDPNFMGIAVGVIKNGVRYQFYYGETKHGNGQKPQYNTLFAIGSTTKIFTATVLALFSHRGWVHIPEPSGPDAIPATKLKDVTTVPIATARQAITLLDLATHHSGLDREAGSASEFQTGSYAGDMQALMAKLNFCHSVDFPCVAPIPYSEDDQYSDYAFAVLARVLSKVWSGGAPATVNQMFQDEIFFEMNMNHTGDKASLTDASCVIGSCDYADYGQCSYQAECNGTFSRLAAVGYLPNNVRDPNEGSDDNVKAGSGTMWSTIDDMTTFLGYSMGLGYPGFHSEMLAIVPDIFALRDDEMALAWRRRYLNSGRFTRAKGGDLASFNAWIAFIEGGDAGVVVLSNSGDYSTGALAERILREL